MEHKTFYMCVVSDMHEININKNKRKQVEGKQCRWYLEKAIQAELTHQKETRKEKKKTQKKKNKNKNNTNQETILDTTIKEKDQSKEDF